MRRQWLRRGVLATLLLSIGLWMVPVPIPAVEVGEKAPDFLMHSTVQETIRLSDYQGKKNVLLFFFLAAFTGV
jgi:AhpC/TSA family